MCPSFRTYFALTVEKDDLEDFRAYWEQAKILNDLSQPADRRVVYMWCLNDDYNFHRRKFESLRDAAEQHSKRPRTSASSR